MKLDRSKISTKPKYVSIPENLYLVNLKANPIYKMAITNDFELSGIVAILDGIDKVSDYSATLTLSISSRGVVTSKKFELSLEVNELSEAVKVYRGDILWIDLDLVSSNNIGLRSEHFRLTVSYNKRVLI